MQLTNNEPILFKPCSGQIVYKDGKTESILACREFINQCEVQTSSGQYIYVPYVVCHPSGYKFENYYFARFDFDKYEYLITDAIKEFQILKEN